VGVSAGRRRPAREPALLVREERGVAANPRAAALAPTAAGNLNGSLNRAPPLAPNTPENGTKCEAWFSARRGGTRGVAVPLGFRLRFEQKRRSNH